MNRRVLQVFIGFALLVGLTAALLSRIRASYVLGQPGVKVVNVPLFDEAQNKASDSSVYLPETIGEYRSLPSPVTRIELSMLPPDTIYGRRVYESPDRFQAMISVVLMGTDRTSIHKPQYCLNGQGETILNSEVITVPIARPQPYALEVMKLTTSSQIPVGGGKYLPASGLFLYWFVADGQLTPHHGERMWLMGRDLLTKGLLQRWAYIAYFARCQPGQEGALLERMKNMIAASVPEFQTTPGPRAEPVAFNALNPLHASAFEKAVEPWDRRAILSLNPGR